MALHLVLDHLVAERGADLLLHLIEGLGLALLALGHHDDVVAVLRLHHVADLAGLEREGDLVELGHHAPRAEGAEVAALAGRNGVGRLLARQVGELVRVRLQLGEELPGGVLVLHQDVARVHLGGRIEDRVPVVLRLHLLVGDGGRRLVFPHHALHDQTLAEVVHLPRDLRILVVARLRALRVEEVVHDQVLDELPLALRRRQVGARRGRQALELLRDAAAGQRVPLVGGDDLAPRLAGGALGRRGRRGSAAALLVLLAAGRRECGEDERARAPGDGSHTAEWHAPGLAGSQFCAAACRAVDDPRRAAAPPRACVRGTAVAAQEALRVAMAAAANDPGAASGVLAPPSWGVPSGTPRRSSLRLPLSLPGSFASLTMATRTAS